MIIVVSNNQNMTCHNTPIFTIISDLGRNQQKVKTLKMSHAESLNYWQAILSWILSGGTLTGDDQNDLFPPPFWMFWMLSFQMLTG